MVGTLKPSITFGSLPSLQLAPSSLPGASHLVKLSLPDILKVVFKLNGPKDKKFTFGFAHCEEILIQ